MSTLYNNTVTSGRTANGALTNTTSLNPVVDLFFVAGSARNMRDDDLSVMFGNAFGFDRELSLRLIQWLRDVRGGAGERRAFRVLFADLILRDEDAARAVMAKIPELGRWDDLFVAFDTPLEEEALTLIAKGLRDQNGLCAKWMPRKGENSIKIRNFLGLTPKQYRKLVVRLTNVVETQMCANDWDNINYEHVPSVAMSRYRTAFKRHGATFERYIKEVIAGEAKINASAVFPHDILKGVFGGGWSTTVRSNVDRDAIKAQWEALPDYFANSDQSILPLIDVSGSMTVRISGSTTALEVAVGLGLYCAERNNGLFKNEFITFHANPKMLSLHGDVVDKINTIARSDWGGNTDLQKAFDLILNAAKKGNVSPEEMPSTLLILSDMEFDIASSNYWSNKKTNFDEINRKFAEAGYRRPDLVFWNINGRAGNSPVTIGDGGTALVSGYSPSILKGILSGDMTPENVMLRTLLNPRYDV